MTKRDPYKEAAAKQEKDMERVVFNAPAELLARFDEAAANAGHTSRAQALRAAVSLAIQEFDFNAVKDAARSS